MVRSTQIIGRGFAMFEGEKARIFWWGLVIFGLAIVELFRVLCMCLCLIGFVVVQRRLAVFCSMDFWRC